MKPMSLAAGTRLGPYEIASKLGEGGMGEVYLARDTRLAREVAIKVLPRHLAETPEARARFEREARAVSSLNHPHICTLHDVGHENGIDFLVLERIEGETLAAHLSRGALPIHQVLRTGMEIADALDRAHRSGLVHRDLKPGNVMLTRAGAKLMDFGLARLSAGSDSSHGSSLAPTQSPTMAQPVTAEGAIVGTYPYMAPEQLEGKDVDARTDLWALGCVLYEMATGKRAFLGQSQASLISAIMLSEPAPISRLVPLTPPGLDRLVRACLVKDRNERIQSAHDIKLQLQWIAEGETTNEAVASPRSGWGVKAAWAGVTLALAGLAIVGTLAVHKPPADRDVVRFSLPKPSGQKSFGWPSVSHDGRTLAFVAWDTTGASRLWLRPLDDIEAHQVTTMEPAGPPIWSPDNTAVAIIADGKLMRVPVGGGAAIPIADAPGRSTGSWGSMGTIVLESTGRDSLVAISVTDGSTKPATRLDRSRGDIFHGSTTFLPDGQRFLYVAVRSHQGVISAAVMLGRLGSLESRELAPCDGSLAFDPPDHVIYVRGTSLVTRKLDLQRQALTGDPVTLAEGLPPGGNEYLFAAGGGVLVQVHVSGTMSELVWTDRAGRRLSRVGEPDRYRDIALSPDGQRLAFAIEDPVLGMDDVWVRDLDRGVSTRLTFSAAQETSPLWSADGTRIYYGTDRQGGNYLIYSLSVDSPGPEDTLKIGNSGQEGAMSVSPDGKWLAAISSVGAAMDDWNILIRDTQGKEPPRPFCTSPALEFSPAFSPDGRWLAYSSDETGRHEIYVRSFPDGARKWRVSSAGGAVPQWTGGGREIVYQGPNNDLLAVPVVPGPEFRPGRSVTLFHADLAQRGWGVNRWVVTADGERFLLNLSIKNPSRGFTVTRNWEAAIASR